MKRYLLILTLCGSAQAGPYAEIIERMERQQAISQQQEILLQNEKAMKQLEKIERQQKEILSEQRDLEQGNWGRYSPDGWGHY